MLMGLLLYGNADFLHRSVVLEDSVNDVSDNHQDHFP